MLLSLQAEPAPIKALVLCTVQACTSSSRGSAKPELASALQTGPLPGTAAAAMGKPGQPYIAGDRSRKSLQG